MAHHLEYLAAGANRHPSAADWNDEGILAYGTDRNVALWRPQVSSNLLCHMVQNSNKTSLRVLVFYSIIVEANDVLSESQFKRCH